jgi:hypothetical protein
MPLTGQYSPTATSPFKSQAPMFCNRFSKDHTRFKSFLLASTFRSLRFVDRSLGSRIQDPEDPNTGRGGDGIGMALFEETICDPQNGAPINQQVGGLHVDCSCRRIAH